MTNQRGREAPRRIAAIDVARGARADRHGGLPPELGPRLFRPRARGLCRIRRECASSRMSSRARFSALSGVSLAIAHRGGRAGAPSSAASSKIAGRGGAGQLRDVIGGAGRADLVRHSALHRRGEPARAPFLHAPPWVALARGRRRARGASYLRRAPRSIRRVGVARPRNRAARRRSTGARCCPGPASR